MTPTDAAETPIGAVSELWRYPVKSMLGESVQTASVTERGLLGDRAYALIDQESGKVASAKNPRRWAALFECSAAYVESPQVGAELPAVVITLPDGEHVRTDDSGVHDTLSRALGRPVRLEADPPEAARLEQYYADIDEIEPELRDTVADSAIAFVAPDTFFDAAPLHVLTTASLDRLAELAPEARFDVRRFRPNVVVALDDPAPGFIENDWVGHMLAMGETVRGNVFLSVPRCVMTTLAQGELPADKTILQTVARHNRFDIPGLGPSACVGVYALTEADGELHRDDRVTLA